MKIRLRAAPKTTTIFEVPEKSNGEPWTVGELRELIISRLIHPDPILSLNGREHLAGEQLTNTLAQAGICSGDLLYIVNGGSQPAGSQPAAPAPVQTLPATAATGTVTQGSAPPPSSSPSLPTLSKGGEAPSTTPKSTPPAPKPTLLSPAFQEKLGSVLASTLPKIPHDALCGVVHLLMLESGFMTPGSPPSSHPTAFSMPPDWRRNSQYVFQYVHPQAKSEGGEQQQQQQLVTLKCVSMQNLLLIHGSMKGLPQTLSLKVSVPDYVRIDRPLDSGPEVFQRLDQFVRLFKDSISYRLISQVYESTGTTNRASLSGLVPEVKFRILSFLDVRSLVRVGQTCRELYHLSNDPFLWRTLASATFKVPFGPIGSRNWKREFVRKYEEEQELKRQRTERDRNPYAFLPPPHGLIDPQSFYPTPGPSYPGIYGGDYDRLPGALPPFHPLYGPRGTGPTGIGPSPLFPPPGAGVPPGARFDPFGPTPDINPFGNRGRGRRDPFGGGEGGGGFGFF